VHVFLQGFGGGGLTAMIAGLAALFGPIIGGGLTDAYSWRLIFYVNLPPGAFSFYLAWISMKRFEHPTKKLQLDYIGSLLIGISTIALILFVTWGGEATIGYPWDSPQIIALIIIFVISLGLFIVQEYHHPLPTLQLRLHKIKNVWINLFITFFAYYSMISMVNYLAVYFQEVLGNIAVISGLKLCGFVGGFLVTSRFSGKILVKTSKSNYIMGLSGGILALGLGLMVLITPTINYGYIFLFTMLIGSGIGYLIPSTGALIQLAVPQRDIAVAMSNYSFDSYLGGCIGITVSSTIYTRSFQKYKEQGYLPPNAATKAITQTFLWCIPPIVLASILGFFLDPVKQKKT